MDSILRIADETRQHRAVRKILFTIESLSAIPTPVSGRLWVYDERQPGLALQVTAAGVRTFYYCKKIRDGRSIRYRIGTMQEWKVDHARRIAFDKQSEVAKGLNPMDEKAKAKEETRLVDLWENYLAVHAMTRKRSWEEDLAIWNRHLKKWGGQRRLSQITQAMVITFHNQIGATAQYQANRVVALLSVMFSHAERVMEYQGKNPTKGVKRFPEISRERFLQPDELPAFFEALEKEKDETIRDYFKILLFTGARKSNVLGMRWEHLNLPDARWTLPAEEMKNKRPMTIYLSAHALEILRRRDEDRPVMKKFHPQGAAFVFPGRRMREKASKPRKSHCLVEPAKAWKRLKARAQIADLRIHDLRRTLGSWMASTGASTSVIGKTLGHMNQATTAVYARTNLQAAGDAVEKATEAIEKAKVKRPKRDKKETPSKNDTGLLSSELLFEP